MLWGNFVVLFGLTFIHIQQSSHRVCGMQPGIRLTQLKAVLWSHFHKHGAQKQFGSLMLWSISCTSHDDDKRWRGNRVHEASNKTFFFVHSLAHFFCCCCIESKMKLPHIAINLNASISWNGNTSRRCSVRSLLLSSCWPKRHGPALSNEPTNVWSNNWENRSVNRHN